MNVKGLGGIVLLGLVLLGETDGTVPEDIERLGDAPLSRVCHFFRRNMSGDR